MEINNTPSKLTFLGDICLARSLRDTLDPGLLVDNDIRDSLEQSFVIANMESVLRSDNDPDCDHLDFQGDPRLLSGLSCVNLFGLANNHINDFGDLGIDETISVLSDSGFGSCGVNHYVSTIDLSGWTANVIFAADMMNKQFAPTQNHEVLSLYSKELDEILKSSSSLTETTILYVHTGLLFCAFPSIILRERLHQLVDLGVSAVITAHSHCEGGVEYTKSGAPIFYSLGDTIMDGASMRRRRSQAVTIFENQTRLDFEVLDLVFEKNVLKEKATLSRQYAYLRRHLFTFIMSWPPWLYRLSFNGLYRLSMLAHVSSTLMFLVRTLGLRGTMSRVLLRRREALRFFSWVSRDRKQSSTDYDAIEPDRKVIRAEELK